MSITNKILGQSAPGATTEDDTYTVPALTQAHLKIHLANRGVVGSTFRIAIGTNGAGSIANEDYIHYDLTINPGQAWTSKAFELDAGDIVTVWGLTADLSWNIVGMEIT